MLVILSARIRIQADSQLHINTNYDYDFLLVQPELAI